LVRILEDYVESMAKRNVEPDAQAGRDFLVIGELSFPEQTLVQLDPAQASLF